MEPSLRSRLRRAGLIAAATLALASLAIVAFRSRRDQVAGHAYPIPSAHDRILVEVLNGTSRQGLARVGARLLRRQGLDVIYFGNAEAPVESTRVILRRGDPAAARRVAEGLGAGKITEESDSFRRLDVTVILGEDFTPPVEVHP